MPAGNGTENQALLLEFSQPGGQHALRNPFQGALELVELAGLAVQEADEADAPPLFQYREMEHYGAFVHVQHRN